MAEGRLKLGEQLLAAGLVTEEGLREALAEQKAEGGNLTDRLVELGHCDERALLRFLAELSGAKYITVDTLSKANIPGSALDRVPARHAELLCVLPLAWEGRGNVLTLAVPELEQGLLEQVRLAADVATIQPIVALRATIRAGIRRFYYADLYAFATLDHGTAKPVVKPAAPRESIVARSSAPKPTPKAPKDDTAALQRDVERWKAVAELGRVLSREKNTKALLHRALAFCFDRIPADDGVALLWDAKAKALMPRAVRTRTGETREVIVSETLLKEIVAEGGVITTDAAVDERFSGAESVIATMLRGAMGVPLRVNDQLSGAMVFGTRGAKGASFADHHLALAEELGTQVAFEIERIQSNQREEQDGLQRDRYVRHFPPQTAEKALAGQVEIPEKGIRGEVAVLCARVVGESVGAGSEVRPEELFSALTPHAEQMADVVFAHGGMVLDNPGSRTLGLFGIPRKRGDDVKRAYKAAREMVERVTFMNELRLAQGMPSLELAVGVAVGRSLFGQVGERQRAQFSALGDPLDRALVLASAARAGEVMLDVAVHEQLEGRDVGAAEASEPGAWVIKGDGA